jgi:hypothetical protein
MRQVLTVVVIALGLHAGVASAQSADQLVLGPDLSTPPTGQAPCAQNYCDLLTPISLPWVGIATQYRFVASGNAWVRAVALQPQPGAGPGQPGPPAFSYSATNEVAHVDGAGTYTQSTFFPLHPGDLVGLWRENGSVSLSLGTVAQPGASLLTGTTSRFVSAPDTMSLLAADTAPLLNVTVQRAPVLQSITPNEAPPAGGTTATITGWNLDLVTSVTIGKLPATNIVVTDPAPPPALQTMTVTVPPYRHVSHAADVMALAPPGVPTISLGQAFNWFIPRACRVPDVVGLRPAAARRALRRAHCWVGRTVVTHSGGKPGRVARAAPRAGSRTRLPVDIAVRG